MKFILCFSLSLAVFLLLSSCQKQQPSDELNRKIEDIKTTVDVLFKQAVFIQSDLTKPPAYILYDNEHKKNIGLLKTSLSLQLGNFIVWDDDIYEIKAVRVVSQKRGDEKEVGMEVRSVETVEVGVKFLTKMIQPENNP